MPNERAVRIVRALASHGYNAEREAVTLLAGAEDPDRALARTLDALPADALTVSRDHVRSALDADTGRGTTPDADAGSGDGADPTAADPASTSDADSTSGADPTAASRSPPETKGVGPGAVGGSSGPGGSGTTTATGSESATAARALDVAGDVTGESTGTGEYGDYVSLFRDRYDRLAGLLRGRVRHRPTDALENAGGGETAGLVGMVDDVRSTANGHWIVDLEDTNGTFPCLVMKDRDVADRVPELLHDEVVAVEGTLADDGTILFVDSLHFPDVPRTFEPSTADRHVQAALVSDVHVGSQEFAADAWDAFADWLHTAEAEHVEYLLIAGDMVEGVGVYPGQDAELDVIDIYEQYEVFAERLKAVPGDIEILMIPGNHDAVRLAEPQPAFTEELRDIMSVHDARVVGNPSTVTVEGVSILMYHGVSLDEVIAETPDDAGTYDDPHLAMHQLLRKRHLAPQYGGQMRIAPEPEDYLVLDEVPDVFHAGHVHKLGWGAYHGVLAVNSGCWQHQTDFQRRNNIDPDWGYAPILDLDTLELTVRKFR